VFPGLHSTCVNAGSMESHRTKDLHKVKASLTSLAHAKRTWKEDSASSWKPFRTALAAHTSVPAVRSPIRRGLWQAHRASRGPHGSASQ
jgi:hypothetical protein